MRKPTIPLLLGWDRARQSSDVTLIRLEPLFRGIRVQGSCRRGALRKGRRAVLPAMVAATLLGLVSIQAQTQTIPDAASILNAPDSSPLDAGLLAPLIDGLLGKYGWLTTVLLAVGSLRILFKPIMLVVENTVKNDPAKLDAIQKFEAGPIYKTIATVLDVGASIKLPLVKPPGPRNP